MSVTPPTSATTLATEDQLWLFSQMFRNDWSGGVQLDRTFKTNISVGNSGAEQRYSLGSKGRLSQQFSLLAGGREDTFEGQSTSRAKREVSALHAIARRYTIAKSPMPIFCDETVATAFTGDGATALPCDTADRRFEVGKRVLVVAGVTDTDETGPYYDNNYPIHIAVVTGITPTEIQFDAATANNTPAGSRIFPMYEARLMLRLGGDVLTDAVATLDITAVEESAGDEQLAPSQAIGTVPAGVVEYDGLPVLDPDYDYAGSISWGFERAGSTPTSGIASVVEAFGSRGMATFEFSILALDRAAAFESIRFFDSRGGRKEAFWLVPPTNEVHTCLFVSGNQIIVAASGEDVDWQLRPHIFVRGIDGTLYGRGVSSFSHLSNDLYMLTVDEVFPVGFSSGDVDEVGLLLKSRFTSDAMSEQWLTTEMMESQFSTIELEQEKDITVADLTDFATSNLVNAYVKGACSDNTTPATVLVLEPCRLCDCRTVSPELGDPSVCPDAIYRIDGSSNPAAFQVGNVLRLTVSYWIPLVASSLGAYIKPSSNTNSDLWDSDAAASFSLSPHSLVPWHSRRTAFVVTREGNYSNSEPTWRNAHCTGDVLVDGEGINETHLRRTMDCVKVVEALEDDYPSVQLPDPSVAEIFTAGEGCDTCYGPVCPCEDDGDPENFSNRGTTTLHLCGTRPTCNSIEDEIADLEANEGIVICNYITQSTTPISSCDGSPGYTCDNVDILYCTSIDLPL